MSSVRIRYSPLKKYLPTTSFTHCLVAQLAEQGAVNSKVSGSSPDWAVYYYMKMKRLMSDRDHLEALIYAAEHLLHGINQATPEESMEMQIRLSKAVSRARQDLYPED